MSHGGGANLIIIKVNKLHLPIRLMCYKLLDLIHYLTVCPSQTGTNHCESGRSDPLE